MKLIQTIKELRAELDTLRKEGKSVGLVPTMGALHAGHASLVKRAVAENDVVVVSDFVNPTQFNDQNDLLKYPRTLEADCKLLDSCGVTFVFAPSVEEIYPEPDTRQFSYAPLDTVMEGKFRPGHFNGVCQLNPTVPTSERKISSSWPSSAKWYANIRSTFRLWDVPSYARTTDWH